MKEKMRKIKFRAFYEGKMWPASVLNNCTHVGDVIDLDFESMEATVSLFDAPLMQYIGLKDKNGKEIYESDIVGGCFKKNCGCKINMIGEVFYDHHSFSLKVIAGDQRSGMVNYFNFIASFYDVKNNDLDSGFFREIEIIGNIYENPELLNKPPSKYGLGHI